MDNKDKQLFPVHLVRDIEELFEINVHDTLAGQDRLDTQLEKEAALRNALLCSLSTSEELNIDTGEEFPYMRRTRRSSVEVTRWTAKLNLLDDTMEWLQWATWQHEGGLAAGLEQALERWGGVKMEDLSSKVGWRLKGGSVGAAQSNALQSDATQSAALQSDATQSDASLKGEARALQLAWAWDGGSQGPGVEYERGKERMWRDKHRRAARYFLGEGRKELGKLLCGALNHGASLGGKKLTQKVWVGLAQSMGATTLRERTTLEVALLGAALKEGWIVSGIEYEEREGEE